MSGPWARIPEVSLTLGAGCVTSLHSVVSSFAEFDDTYGLAAQQRLVRHAYRSTRGVNQRPVSNTSSGRGFRSGCSAAKFSPMVRGRVPMRRASSARSQGIDHGVQLREAVDLGDRDQVVAAVPADLALHAALLVSTGDAGLAVEGIQAVVGAERGPSVGLDSLTVEPDHLRDRGLEIVVADLANRYPEDPERMGVALEERLLTGRCRHPVHRLTRVRQP